MEGFGGNLFGVKELNRLSLQLLRTPGQLPTRLYRGQPQLTRYKPESRRHLSTPNPAFLSTLIGGDKAPLTFFCCGFSMYLSAQAIQGLFGRLR